MNNRGYSVQVSVNRIQFYIDRLIELWQFDCRGLRRTEPGAKGEFIQITCKSGQTRYKKNPVYAMKQRAKAKKEREKKKKFDKRMREKRKAGKFLGRNIKAVKGKKKSEPIKDKEKGKPEEKPKPSEDKKDWSVLDKKAILKGTEKQRKWASDILKKQTKEMKEWLKADINEPLEDVQGLYHQSINLKALHGAIKDKLGSNAPGFNEVHGVISWDEKPDLRLKDIGITEGELISSAQDILQRQTDAGEIIKDYRNGNLPDNDDVVANAVNKLIADKQKDVESEKSGTKAEKAADKPKTIPLPAGYQKELESYNNQEFTTGSDKQKKWAQEIRQEQIEDFIRVVEGKDPRAVNRGFEFKPDGVVIREDKFRKNVREALDRMGIESESEGEFVSAYYKGIDPKYFIESAKEVLSDASTVSIIDNRSKYLHTLALPGAVRKMIEEHTSGKENDVNPAMEEIEKYKQSVQLEGTDKQVAFARDILNKQINDFKNKYAVDAINEHHPFLVLKYELKKPGVDIDIKALEEYATGKHGSLEKAIAAIKETRGFMEIEPHEVLQKAHDYFSGMDTRKLIDNPYLEYRNIVQDAIVDIHDRWKKGEPAYQPPPEKHGTKAEKAAEKPEKNLDKYRSVPDYKDGGTDKQKKFATDIRNQRIDDFNRKMDEHGGDNYHLKISSVLNDFDIKKEALEDYYTKMYGPEKAKEILNSPDNKIKIPVEEMVDLAISHMDKTKTIREEIDNRNVDLARKVAMDKFRDITDDFKAEREKGNATRISLRDNTEHLDKAMKDIASRSRLSKGEMSASKLRNELHRNGLYVTEREMREELHRRFKNGDIPYFNIRTGDVNLDYNGWSGTLIIRKSENPINVGKHGVVLKPETHDVEPEKPGTKAEKAAEKTTEKPGISPQESKKKLEEATPKETVPKKPKWYETRRVQDAEDKLIAKLNRVNKKHGGESEKYKEAEAKLLKEIQRHPDYDQLTKEDPYRYPPKPINKERVREAKTRATRATRDRK